jgi:hypothetical protein
MVLKVAYLTPAMQREGRRQNVGDAIIQLGVRNIMRCAIGAHEERLVDMAGDEPIPADTDILVVCGTPQVAHTGIIPDTLRRTRQAADAPVPVRLNLGIGAFYFDAFGLDRPAADAAFAERVRTGPAAALYAGNAGFHLCAARDMAATAALRAVGVPAIPLPCPGFFSPLFQPRPLVRRTTPLVSVLNGTASFWHRVAADMHSFHDRLRRMHPDMIFLAHDEEDVEMLTDQGIPHLAFETAEELVAVLAMHTHLLSLRVHSAVPGWSLGMDVTLLGIDRRALLGEDFGASLRVLPLRTEKDFKHAEAASIGSRPLQDEATREAWLARHLEIYVRNIRGTVEAELGPLPAREDPQWPPLPSALGLHGTAGRYHARLFHSLEPSFTVSPDQLQSRCAAEADSTGLTLATDGTHRTLLYGPYLNIPRGRWMAQMDITAEPPAGSDAVRPQLGLSITKGIPGAILAEETVAPPPGTVEPCLVNIEFDNPRDTGLVETVLRSSKALPAGWRIRVAGLRFHRIA